jgi:hypothetical protein
MKPTILFPGTRPLAIVALAALTSVAFIAKPLAQTSSEPYFDTTNDPVKGGTSNNEMSGAGPNKIENATRSDIYGTEHGTVVQIPGRSTRSSATQAAPQHQAAPQPSQPVPSTAPSTTESTEQKTETTTESATKKKSKSKRKQKGAAHKTFSKGHQTASASSASQRNQATQQAAAIEEVNKRITSLESQVQNLQSDLATEQQQNEALRSELSNQTATEEQAGSAEVIEGQHAEMGSNVGSISGGTIAAPTEGLKASPQGTVLEPNSIDPFHVGSTSTTGKDKSVAVLERNDSPFVDPQARALAMQSRNASRPLSEINFADYTYYNRGHFQSDMNSRLDKMDRELDILRAKIGSASGDVSRAEANLRVYDLETLRARAGSTLSHADDIGAENWEGLKSQFRSELSALEGSFQALNAAVR